MSVYRVAIVFDNFGPYHVARLRGAQEAGLDVLGVQIRAKSSVYAWNEAEVPKELVTTTLLSETEKPSRALIRNRLDEKVAAYKLDAIALPGWSSISALAALEWARENEIATILMSETNAHDFRRFAVTEWLKSQIVAGASAALCSGADAKRYLATLGLPDDVIFTGYNAVDNSYFATEADRARGGLMPALNGAPMPASFSGRYLLASARFVPKKNLPKLIEAYGAWRRSNDAVADGWPLIVLGEGPERPAIELAVARHDLVSHVFLPGFQQIDELPRWFGHAGALIHASTTEQWGLVVNEAMAAGLPVLVSERCGCANELVESGVNGYRFDPLNTSSIKASIATLIAAGEEARVEMGRQSRRIVADYGPRAFGDGMARAASAAIRRGRSKTHPGADLMRRLSMYVQR